MLTDSRTEPWNTAGGHNYTTPRRIFFCELFFAIKIASHPDRLASARIGMPMRPRTLLARAPARNRAHTHSH